LYNKYALQPLNGSESSYVYYIPTKYLGYVAEKEILLLTNYHLLQV